ncbi:uncharacterized protein LOC124836214 isoform X1 [Vigna umbellata]|uniref:uncharacterized protein LOC124836214 isoform X1 n=2 Tax=Vigna umbellata TaxID=87088 RepID=UPI001F5EEBA6|nr:uncharacterized protein LOC124836214 isoform X1 [Vigna umbellata]
MVTGRMVTPVINYSTEFRAYEDDAWYTVCVLFHGDTLTVKFLGFPPENDVVFPFSYFQNSKDLEAFKRRFRPLSKQLQDEECGLLTPGTRVCACHFFNNEDIRFYDAVVDGVQESEHSWKTGEEECLCTFILFWLHGPNARKLTATSIENICVVQPRWELDPVVASFLDNCSSFLMPKEASGFGMVQYCNNRSNSARQITYFGRTIKETQCARRSVVNACLPEVSCLKRRMEDRDLGGPKNVCMILITNMDKELCPSTVTEFLRRHTSLSVLVFIFPNLSMEVYNRGAIMVHSEKELQELCGFLNNPNCIITSSTGRPLVILEKLVGLENIKASIGALVHISENILQEKQRRWMNNLKVVHLGSKEFKIASIMRDLFWAFSEHQERLQKRLALEERRIFAANEQLA